MHGYSTDGRAVLLFNFPLLSLSLEPLEVVDRVNDGAVLMGLGRLKWFKEPGLYLVLWALWFSSAVVFVTSPTLISATA